MLQNLWHFLRKKAGTYSADDINKVWKQGCNLGVGLEVQQSHLKQKRRKVTDCSAAGVLCSAAAYLHEVQVLS